MPRILIIAGEASGDLHGANLAAAIKRLDAGAEIIGVGGRQMASAGVELVPDIPALDIIGLIGPGAVSALIRRIRRIRRLLETQPFDVVVLVDNPGLNLHFAKVAKRAGHRVVYYIAPQLWAWRPGRMRWMQHRVDHTVVILPFEEPLYRRAGVPVTFVGHPLLDSVEPSYDRTELRKRFGVDGGGPVLGLLPGSRAGEVRVLLPAMLHAAARLLDLHPTMQFIMAQAGSIDDRQIDPLLAGSSVKVHVVKNHPSEVMAAADLLLVASGTATLQAAVVGTPMVVIYRVPRLTYWIGRLLVRVKWISLVNLVAGRPVVPEVIQNDLTPERLTEEVAHLLRDRAAYRQMRESLKSVRDALGEPGASTRAAAVVLAEARA
ncbi:lipid-A-disaccharide synthase [Candidatus Nitrospira bockiana]